MKIKGLLTLNAVVAGASGICGVLIPRILLDLAGIIPDPSTLLMARYAGLGSLVICLVAWLFRNVSDAEAERAVVLTLLIANLLGASISVSGIISGIMMLGWPVFGLYLIFAVGYAYFQFFERDVSRS
jgi:hypothetical protein